MDVVLSPHDSTGCVWDGTGCFGDCDQQQMKDRCAEMEAQDQCESDDGAQKRCRWNFGTAHVLDAFVVGRSVGFETDISTTDLLLAVATLITVAVCILGGVYRWYRNREYKTLNEVEMAQELGGNVSGFSV